MLLPFLVCLVGQGPALPTVDVPARRLLHGAQVLIGLNESQNQRGALAPDGGLFALAGGEDGVQLLEVDTGRGVAWRKDLLCHEPDPNYVGPCEPRVAFSKDGGHLWVYWPLSKKLLRLSVPGLRTETEASLDDCFDLVPLPNGRVVGLRNKDSVVVDAEGKVETFYHHQNAPLAVSPDGGQIAFEESDLAVIYDVGTGVRRSTSPEPGATEKLAFLPDGRGWLAGKIDSNGYADIFFWRAGAENAQLLASSAEGLTSVFGEVVEHWMFAAPYTELWVSMRKAGALRIDLNGRRTPFGAYGVGKAVVRRGRQLVVQGHDCVARVDQQGALLPGIQLCGVRPSLLAFDGARLLAQPWGTSDIDRYDAKSGAYLSSVTSTLPAARDHRTLSLLSRDEALRAKVARAFRLAKVKAGPFSLSEDGRWLLAGSRSEPRDAAVIDLSRMAARTGLLSFVVAGNGSIMIQDRLESGHSFDVRRVHDQKLLRTITLDLDPIYLQLSHDGKYLVAEGFAEGMNKTVVVNVVTGRKIFEPGCRASYTGYFEFSKDGTILVCDRLQETVLFRVPSGKLLRRFPHLQAEAADAFALSDDGRKLAIAAGALRIFPL